MGHKCDRPCDENHYGKDCKKICNCQNAGACNAQDGTCTCSPGWVGETCDTKCQSGMFGFNCSQKCECDFNNAIYCDGADGSCVCKALWGGEFVDNNFASDPKTQKKKKLHHFVILL